MHAPSTLQPDFIKKYRSYRNLPPLVGLGTFPEAAEPGLSLDDSVDRLKRHHYALKRLHQIFIAHLTAEPIYELKMAYSYHAWLCAENVAALRERVGEMREPPLGLDKVPDPALEIFFDEILGAPAVNDLLAGIYGVAIPAIIEGLKRHLEETHLLADQPTRRLCRRAIGDMEEILAYGEQAIKCLTAEKPSTCTARLQEILAAAGGMDGTAKPSGAKVERVFSRKAFQYDGIPQRDERFPDPFNLGVNAEVFLYDESMPPEAKVLMMFYKRIREIDVPEMMASILFETEGKPWEYYRDMTRQLWDEARHAMMGEVGFVSLGIDWSKKVMVNHTWSRSLNTQLKPKERHAVLYFIEQGLMPKTGKRHEWEVALMSQNPLAATFQDFDWADEVLHARIGRDWYVKEMPSAQEATDYGDQCWSKVLINWGAFREEGLTEHRNWWPELYQEYCKNFSRGVDPAVNAYHETYESTRPDLKDISVSG